MQTKSNRPVDKNTNIHINTNRSMRTHAKLNIRRKTTKLVERRRKTICSLYDGASIHLQCCEDYYMNKYKQHLNVVKNTNIHMNTNRFMRRNAKINLRGKTSKLRERRKTICISKPLTWH